MKLRILRRPPTAAPRMDVDLTIRYSDDRLCEVVVFRPDTAAPLYRIVSRRADLGASLTGKDA